MTSGLLVSRLTKKKLCLNSIKVPTHENITKFKFFNKLINESKRSFFEQQLKLHQSNMKKAWELINLATRRGLKNKNLICKVSEGKNICDPGLKATLILHILQQKLRTIFPLLTLMLTLFKPTNQTLLLR